MAKAAAKRSATRKRPMSKPTAGIGDAAVRRATGKALDRMQALLEG